MTLREYGERLQSQQQRLASSLSHKQHLPAATRLPAYSAASTPHAAAATAGKRATAAAAAATTTGIQHQDKMSATLARVLLKQELKEALTRRAEHFQQCEIEANQRQYAVHRLLTSGCPLPARVDDLPRVIKCQLPKELLEGCCVVPPPPPKHNTQSTSGYYRPYYSTMPSRGTGTEPASIKPSTSTTGVQTLSATATLRDTQSYTLPRRKELPAEPGAELASSSLRFAQQRPKSTHDQQLRYAGGSAQGTISDSNSSLHRPKPMRNAETQTLLEQQKQQRANEPSTSIKYDLSPRINAHPSTGDSSRLPQQASESIHVHRFPPLDDTKAKKKYDYPFSDDDDAVSREARKVEVRQEIERRREKLVSLTDLTDDKHYFAGSSSREGALPASLGLEPEQSLGANLTLLAAQRASIQASLTEREALERAHADLEQLEYRSLPALQQPPQQQHKLDRYECTHPPEPVPTASIQQQQAHYNSTSALDSLAMNQRQLPLQPATPANTSMYPYDAYAQQRNFAAMQHQRQMYEQPQQLSRSVPYLAETERYGVAPPLDPYAYNRPSAYLDSAYTHRPQSTPYGASGQPYAPLPQRAMDTGMLSSYASYLREDFRQAQSAMNDYYSQVAHRQQQYAAQPQPYYGTMYDRVATMSRQPQYQSAGAYGAGAYQPMHSAYDPMYGGQTGGGLGVHTSMAYQQSLPYSQPLLTDARTLAHRQMGMYNPVSSSGPLSDPYAYTTTNTMAGAYPQRAGYPSTLARPAAYRSATGTGAYGASGMYGTAYDRQTNI
jgi:hypothetical protein